MDFATFLSYHGTTISDQLLYRYAEMYDNFTQFRYSMPYISTDKAFIKWMQQNQQTSALPATYLSEIPIFPCQITTHSNNEPVVVSTTSTSTTAVIESSSTHTDQAVNQLVSEYLDDDIQHIMSLEPLEQPTKPADSPDSPTLSLSSLSTISTSPPPPPELQNFPTLPSVLNISPPPPYTSTMAEPLVTPRKDINVMKEYEAEKKVLPTYHLSSKNQKKENRADPALTKHSQE
jgi:hypothetical protein